ncbi:MAG: dephospho-CoA kinase, partial [Eubacteriales bacterium]
MKTLIVGLTGQTGAGKSTVAAKLAEKGFLVIDGDVVAREIMQAGSPVLKTLANEFGADIIKEDDSLNRRLLASRAFASRDGTARLNGITHPAITENIKQKIAEAKKRGESVIVIDAAVLLESGAAKLCDIIAVVTAPEEIRLNRIMERDDLSKAEAMKRINAQHGEDYYNN